MHIRATYGTHRITYVHAVCIRAVNVYARKCTYVQVSDFFEAVYWLDWSSMCLYFQQILADTDTFLGHHMYACICTYFCQHFWRKYVHIGHGAVTVAFRSPGTGAGLCTFTARLLRQVCRAAAQAQEVTKFNQIRSARPIRAQPAPATWTGTPRLCHGNLGNNGAAKPR